jgi:hypothetical protein
MPFRLKRVEANGMDCRVKPGKDGELELAFARATD